MTPEALICPGVARDAMAERSRNFVDTLRFQRLRAMIMTALGIGEIVLQSAGMATHPRLLLCFVGPVFTRPQVSVDWCVLRTPAKKR